MSAISDRSYDTRLSASSEVQKILARSSKDSTLPKIDLITAVKTEFLSRANANSRKGGLMLLGCIAVGPGNVCADEMRRSIIVESSKLIDDEDSSVRFAACECMYNVMASVVLNEDVFRTLFDSLCKIESDPEIQSSGASFDRSLRDLVMSSKSQEVGVFIAVESRILYPHNFVKQVSIGWLRFLRATFPSTFAMRLPKIVPALISTLSHSSSRDIEVSVDSFICQILADIESGLLEVNIDDVDQLCDVLLKFAKFQSSLNERSRVVLFEFFRIFCPSMISSNTCTGALVAVRSSICDPSTPEDVRISCMRTNSAMINCSKFVEAVCRTNGQDIRELFSVIGASRSPQITQLVSWVYRLKPSLLGLPPSEYLSITRALWYSRNEDSRSEISKILEVVLTQYKNSIDALGNDLVDLLVSTKHDPVFWEVIWGIVGEHHVEIFPDLIKSVTCSLQKDEDDFGNLLILAIIRVFVTSEDSVIREVTTDSKFLTVLRNASPVAFLLVCIRANSFEPVAEAFTHWHENHTSLDSETLDVFVDVFESEALFAQRMSLVRPEGTSLANVLMNILLLSNPECRASKSIGSRLQLAGLSRSF